MAALKMLDWQQWVGLRPTSPRVHRRKAAGGGWLPGSCRSPMSLPDPDETFAVAVLERPVIEWSRHTERGLTANYSAIAAGQPAPIDRQQFYGKGP